MNGDYSGIDPARMDDFERGLGRAEDALSRNEPQIHRTLQRLDLDTSGLGALREMRSWIGTSRPDLRRRNETIRTKLTEWGATTKAPSGLAAFDETLYGKAGHNPDVYAATFGLGRTAEDGKVDGKLLTGLEKRAGDATFAAALMNALGAARFRELMVETAKRKDDKKAERLQAALGKTLGTANPRLGDAWWKELLSDLDTDRKGGYVGWEKGYAATLALKHGTFSTAFLLATARKIESADRETPLDPRVMVTLLEGLSRDPAAAQDFFAGDPTMLKRFLTERGLSDDGVVLGKVLEAATLTFRDHNGSPQNPSRGFLSAKLASELVHLEAVRIKEGSSDSSVNAASMGRVLAGYISDINHVAQKGDNSIAAGVRGADSPGTSEPEPWGAQFNKGELRQVMKEAFADPKAFAPVLAAQTVFTGWLLDYGAAEMAAGHGGETLLNSARRAGAGFGMITDAAGLAKIEEGKDLDEAQQRNMKLLMAVVNTGLIVPQTGAWPVIADVTGAWTGMIEDTAKGSAEDNARIDANAAVDRTRGLVHDLAAQAMLKNGLFGSAEPAGRNHPWATLEGLEKGDDPRDNPNNFLKDDGRTLMTRDEMIDKTATNTTDQYRRVEAYDRWLYEGLSGKPWREAESLLELGFSAGFDKYGS
ncbi:hypothetical protein OIE13_31655 [Streptosporangium sp. NBC_01810]|uniref:hypothetical protein n=1 Tax=Streptosporangium sp. NBC_01810 TaxID=2975951 RepID=UPI002DD8C277|nr:hypothetical protein [Streptosporangium sp. NBC_01810]WSA25428.1 hypothetical protein OIE13_31655 [Streptosporangium sp. NBC_01810]